MLIFSLRLNYALKMDGVDDYSEVGTLLQLGIEERYVYRMAYKCMVCLYVPGNLLVWGKKIRFKKKNKRKKRKEIYFERYSLKYLH